jgi:serine/threonine protein kinase
VFFSAIMCHETPTTIAPRIIALLREETVPWTGNEILGRIAVGDDPCELHFDETIRQLIRDRKLTCDSDVFAPTLTSTTRCRLAYVLTEEAKAPTLIQPVPASKPPPTAKAPTIVAVPSVPAAPMVPALPSPAARLEAIGRLRDEKARLEREWTERFGPDCFRSGPAAFVKALFQQVRVHGMLPRLRDALERAQGRRIDDFERHLENLLLVNDRDGTIPVMVLDAGVKLDLMAYVALDLDRCEREIREGREGNPSNARELLAFLKSTIDHPSLRPPPSPPPTTPYVDPTPERPPGPKPPMVVLHTGTTKVTREPSDDPLVGTTFGAYKVLAPVGQGGMGAVYEGLDETLERKVALKVLHAQFADNREYQDRFLREARNAANAKLDHPNITQIYAAGRQGAHLWLAMQFVRGRTLAKVLQERKTLPPDEALRIVRQTAEGLSVAHAAGMIHRDIKPDNLMIDETGRVKIMDFGLMRSIDVKKDGLTQDGLFVGTLEYASPEQCQDKVLDPRTDLYSLGVVLYQLLSGNRPYEARTAFGYLSMIPDPQQPPVPLRRHLAEIPPAIDELVHKLIAKRPEDRFASAQDLIQAIDGILGAAMRMSAVTRPVPTPTRSAMGPVIAGALALVAVIAGAIFFWPKDPPPTKSAQLPEKPPPPAPSPVPAPLPGKPPTAPTPIPAAPPRDPRLALLVEHVPSASELDLLEQLLAVSRSTLAARRAYAFDSAAEKVLEFRRSRTLPPWVDLIAQTEAERLQAVSGAFRARPIFDPQEERQLELRDGRTLRGRVVAETGDRLTVESAEGREELPLAMVAPSTFPAARGRKLDAVLVRSGAGDAAGSLPLLAALDEVDRRRLAPTLVDQAIEETLQNGDLKAIAAFELPADHRPLAEALLRKRLVVLTGEKEAAAIFFRPEREESLKTLIMAYGTTRAGLRAAREALESFDQSVPADEKFELVSAAAWGTWDVDTRDGPGGAVVFDKAKNVIVLSAPTAKEQVRLLKKLKGAERGYRLRWTFGPGVPDSAAFMIAISFTRWFEAGPRGITLFRADKEGASEKITTARRVELAERLSGGVIHVVPRASLVLVYVNGRLVFALPEKEYALGGGLQLGMSGGSVTMESLRVLDRTRD